MTRVSIVIPTYNRESFISECIDSCLHQSNTRLEPEIIIVDDGSTDVTASCISKYGNLVRYIPQTVNRGRNFVRNVGLEVCTGKYVKFLDSDDLLLPNTLGLEVQIAEETGADIVISGWREESLESNGKIVESRTQAAPVMSSILDDVLAGKAVPTSAALYRRSLVSGLRWDEALRELDDWDWFIQASIRAKVIKTAGHTSYVWRQHNGQGIRSYSMLGNAKAHHYILRKLERELNSRNELSEIRMHRLAQYFYKELRVLALYDLSLFNSALIHIKELDGSFQPREEERQWGMKVACRLLGVRRAVLLHCKIKKALRKDQI